MDTAALYDEDIVTWAEQQAAAVRALARRPDLSNALDWENVAEEIESLGKSQISAAESHIALILVHLIKKLSAPDSPAAPHWRSEILAFQIAMRRIYTPSMRQRIDWNELWTSARDTARAMLTPYGETLIRGLPDQNPFSPEMLTSRAFEVDAALIHLSKALDSGPEAH